MRGCLFSFREVFELMCISRRLSTRVWYVPERIVVLTAVVVQAAVRETIQYILWEVEEAFGIVGRKRYPLTLKQRRKFKGEKDLPKAKTKKDPDEPDSDDETVLMEVSRFYLVNPKRMTAFCDSSKCRNVFFALIGPDERVYVVDFDDAEDLELDVKKKRTWKRGIRTYHRREVGRLLVLSFGFSCIAVSRSLPGCIRIRRNGFFLSMPICFVSAKCMSSPADG